MRSVTIEDLYTPDPVCPNCGTPAPADWEDHIDMDYYWQGWVNGDAATVYCRACDQCYKAICRTVVTFTSEPLK